MSFFVTTWTSMVDLFTTHPALGVIVGALVFFALAFAILTPPRDSR